MGWLRAYVIMPLVMCDASPAPRMHCSRAGDVSAAAQKSPIGARISGKIFPEIAGDVSPCEPESDH